MTNSDICSSTSSSSSNSDATEFIQAELLEIIAISLLPSGSEVALEITKWKDVEIIDLLEQFYHYFDFEDEDLKIGFAKIITFINNNRKEMKKRRVNLNKIDNDTLRLLIVDGMSDVN